MTETDVGVMALMVLSVLGDTPEYTVTSHLSQILDRESFDNLIDAMGGMTIRIPTREEVNWSLRVVLVYYYSRVKGYKIKTSVDKSGLTWKQFQAMEPYWEKVCKVLDHLK